MTTEPRAQLPDLFSKGAEHYGFEGEVWTRLRVGEVIKPHFGVHYEVSTIGLLLKPLGFTLQKPIRRDYRQNLARVTPWREETWPELKTTAEPEDQLVFYVDESAFYLLPPVRKTWAPVGQTPILIEGGQSAHWSVRGEIIPHGDIYYRRQESSYTGSAVAQLSRDLLGLTPQKLHIIGDGASIPRSQAVKDW